MSKHYAVHPEDFKKYGTSQLRDEFLLTSLFEDDVITHHYIHYDRLIAGGVKPVARPLTLETIDDLKADFFLQRREIGIINVGETGHVSVDGVDYELKKKEALYAGRGTKKVIFHASKNSQPLFYYNSAPAHAAYPTRKIGHSDAEVAEVGSLETSNARTIRKLIVNSVLPTCQLQMGLTELKSGSVWNTMPAHTHDRRMEVYFYFDIAGDNRVCHFLGTPGETRHVWVNNCEAVLSPPWSIHCGAGTSSYTFIWGMAGENLDYSDMDAVRIQDLT
ncbi:MAG: 5-dehydro-4-deoxy-D-glucuronate isomerase [Bacteroidota bacterium]|nr:5-dehydro-4-deoxy-D-glucuronate isomerase [Bacteroidota bacterium]